MRTKKMGIRNTSTSPCKKAGYCNIEAMKTLSCVNYGSVTQTNGYCYIDSSFFLKEDFYQDLCLLMASFAVGLGQDPDVKFRLRTKSSYTLFQGALVLDPHTDYNQPRNEEDNQDGLGGVSRKFKPFEDSVLSNSLFQDIIAKDIQIAKYTGEIDFSQKIYMGLHQVRYLITGKGAVSYSSPPFQHKDNEDVVFVHLMGSSANLVGGTNTIIEDKQPIFVVDLKSPLETLLVTRKHFHAVQPLTISSGEIGYRDILIVTFTNTPPKRN